MECKCSGKRQKTDHKRDTFISPEEDAPNPAGLTLANYDTNDTMSIVLSFLGSQRDFGALIIVSKTMAPHILEFMDAQVSINKKTLPTHGWMYFDGTPLD